MLALSYLSNDADYNAAALVELAPEIEEVLVNWEAWATITSANLTLEHPRDPGRLESGLSARYALASTDVFDATNEVQEGRDTSQFVVVRADVGGPTSGSLRGQPVLWDLFGDWVGLYSVDRDSLGFDQFFQLGSGLTARAIRGVPPLRLSAGWIVGPDIRGWSLGVSLDL